MFYLFLLAENKGLLFMRFMEQHNAVVLLIAKLFLSSSYLTRIPFLLLSKYLSRVNSYFCLKVNFLKKIYFNTYYLNSFKSGNLTNFSMYFWGIYFKDT